MSRRESEWAAWMRAALDGDARAYRLFLESVTPYVRAVARSQCRSLRATESEAEDAVQEVLLAIHLKRGTWDPSRPIGPWIGAIARNKLIDGLRRRGRYIDVPIDDVVDSLPVQDQTDRISMHDVETLLGHLKVRQQDIVRSISVHGHTISDTADRLKMTEGAVRVSLHRALKALGALYRSSARED